MKKLLIALMLVSTTSFSLIYAPSDNYETELKNQQRRLEEMENKIESMEYQKSLSESDRQFYEWEKSINR